MGPATGTPRVSWMHCSREARALFRKAVRNCILGDWRGTADHKGIANIDNNCEVKLIILHYAATFVMTTSIVTVFN